MNKNVNLIEEDREEFVKKGKKNKKNIITSIVVLFLTIGIIMIAGINYLFNRVNENIKFTEEEAIEIALGEFDGEVIKVQKEIELEDGTVEYEIKIKTKENIIVEVTVDGSYGAIIDMDRNGISDID